MASFLAIIGYQLIVFAVSTKIFAVREGFHPPSPALNRAFGYLNLEIGLLSGVAMCLVGVVLLVAAVVSWKAQGFGQLDPRVTMRQVIPAVVAGALGVQTVFASFFLSILGIRHDSNRIPPIEA